MKYNSRGRFQGRGGASRMDRIGLIIQRKKEQGNILAQDLQIACFGNSEKPIWQEWGVYVGIRKNIIEEKL